MVVDYEDYTIPVVQIGTVTVTGTVAVSGTVTVTGAVTVTGTVSVSGTVTVTGTVAISGTVTVTGTVAVSGTVTVTGTVSISGTVTVTGSVTVSGTVSISGTVAVSGTVSISGTVTVTGSVTVSGSVSISGTVTVTGSVTVSGTVSISGSVTVTGSVTVSGPVTVSTVAADNIIIDKLTVGAYIEKQRTLSNNAETALEDYATGNNRLGKFFPRGTRGFLSTVGVLCKDAGTEGGIITVYIAPNIGMGAVASQILNVGAGVGWDWRNVTFNRMWNYDSLFVWYVCSIVDIKVGYDIGINGDCYFSTDAGATWLWVNQREWLRASFTGQTVGDIPISGIVNTIEIPSSSSAHDSGAFSVPAQQYVYDNEQFGSGRLLFALFFTSSTPGRAQLCPSILCDGVEAMPWLGALDYWNSDFIVQSTLGICIGKWDVSAERYALVVVLNFPFKRSLKLGFFNASTTTAYSGRVFYSYEKVS